MSALSESWTEVGGELNGREFRLIATVHDEEMSFVLHEVVGGIPRVSRIFSTALRGYGPAVKKLLKKLKKVKGMKVML